MMDEQLEDLVQDIEAPDELEIDDFLVRRSPDEVAELVGDLEVVADVETGEEFANNDVAESPSSLAISDLDIDDEAELDMDLDLSEDVWEKKTSSYDRTQLMMAVESIIMVSENPVSEETLSEILESTPSAIAEICQELADEYAKSSRGFILSKVAGGYRFGSHPAMREYVERFVMDGQSSKLSGAALETLAIVAYKQPVSRAQIASIRGVNVDGVMRTLETKGWVGEIGKDDGPGQAILYGTSQLFLEKLGLNSLEDLPPLGEFMPEADVLDALERTLAGGERDARVLRSSQASSDDINEIVDSQLGSSVLDNGAQNESGFHDDSKMSGEDD